MRLPGWDKHGRWGEHVLVLALYSLLALVLSYPLVLHFGDAIPGVQGDVWSYVWAMGWARSGVELGVNPFRNDFVFYPLGGATQLLWASALPSFASLPLQYAFGLIPAFNLTYLAATVLTAYGTYLLALYVLQGIGNYRFAAFLSGAAFSFCALRLGYGLAFTNLFHTELIPIYVLFLLRATRERKWRHVIWAGVLLGLNAYIDFQIAAFLALFSVLWVIYLFISEWRSKAPAQEEPQMNTDKHGSGRIHLHSWTPRTGPGAVFIRGFIVALIGLAVAAPMGVVVAQDMAAEGGNYIRVYPTKYSAARSYDLLSFFLPNGRSSLYQELPAPRVAGINAAVNVEGESHLSPDRQSFIGLTVLALAVLGAWRRPRAALFWIISTLVFALFSLGPVLHIAGQELAIPLPYALLQQVPIVNHIRIPMRYGIMAMLGAAVLAGMGAQVLVARFRPLPVTFILTGLILAEAAVLPYPTLDWNVPEVYHQIASDPGDFTVLEIPTFNWRSTAATEVYQVIDNKRRLRVYTNRIAPDIADYFSQRQTPVVTRSLRVLEGMEDGTLTNEQLEGDRAAAAEVVGFFKLRYIVVHRDWLDANRVTEMDRYLREVLGAQQFYAQGSVLAYRFPTSAVAWLPQSIGLASDESLMHLGRGWQTEPLAEVEQEQGRFLRGGASEFYFRTTCDPPTAQGANSRCGPAEFQIRAYSEKSGVVLQLQVDGHSLNPVELKAGWADYRITLPSNLSSSGMSVLRFLYPDRAESIAIQSLEIH